MAVKTVGVCGYGSSGSSAFIDILREFDNVRIMDNGEFSLLHCIDGIGDLDYQINRHMTHASSTVAMHRFRKVINKKTFCTGKLTSVDRENLKKITENYLKKITMCSYQGPMKAMRMLEQDHFWGLIKNTIHKLMKKLNPQHRYPSVQIELSINPPDFEEITKNYVIEVLGIVDKKSSVEQGQKIQVIDQFFPVRNTENYFKYVENSAAIIVDRDPRDHYLFAKKFLAPRGRIVCPCDNVENYIKYFRATRQFSQVPRESKYTAFFKFEELVYDCENTAKRLADFIGAANRVRKGECFKPAHSRNNVQLFKKYTEYESDIKKIEQELPEFLFPFENYSDIDPEGGMFDGSQHKKRFV